MRHEVQELGASYLVTGLHRGEKKSKEMKIYLQDLKK